MQLHNLKKNKANREAKQIGRGGKRGKTSGKGTKGQNARSGRKKRPEMRDIIKRIPKLRGRGKNSFKSIKIKSVVVNLASVAEKFKEGEVVTKAALVEKGLIESKNGKLPEPKILGGLKISKSLTLNGLKVSESVKKFVTEAGGKIL